MSMSDDFVGARVRYWRTKRGLSQTALAGLIGRTQGYISLIEGGTREAGSRATLISLAKALQVSVADLADTRGPDFPEHVAADAAIPDIRAALNVVMLGGHAEPARSIDQLTTASAELSALRTAARYDQLAQRVPGVLLDLHAHASGSDEAAQRQALRLTIQTVYNAVSALRYLLYPDLASIVAEIGHDAAVRLGEPSWGGVADFTRLHFLPIENRVLSLDLLKSAADRLRPNGSESAQAHGMLHLSAALTSAVSGKADNARAHLDEAGSVAARVGEADFASMHFGPTNVGFWRVMVAVELGEGSRVAELARDIHPELITANARRAGYYTDLGRGMAQTRRHDQEAIAHFLKAESIAPQWVRLNPAVRETVGTMLRRARADAGGARLRNLASRVGVA